MVDKDQPYRLYPLKFQPILKEKVWGGSKLHRLFNKEASNKIGESWELSGVKGSVSVVSNGPLQQMSLTDVLSNYKDKLVGSSVYNAFEDQFPLLFKFIDAEEDLSVQLHPNDALAQKRHNSFGKTEMWYIMDAEEDARLILGFNSKMDEATFQNHIKDQTITNVLHSEPVKNGDAFFIAPGTVHAIGAGIVLAEIQQTSDITYRIYDWDRPGLDGTMRELHNNMAMDAINYNQPQAKQMYRDVANASVRVCSCPYFETNKLRLTQNLDRNYQNIDSFVVYMCLEGSVNVGYKNTSEILKKGETMLIPAACKQLQLETENATLLEVYIP